MSRLWVFLCLLSLVNCQTPKPKLVGGEVDPKVITSARQLTFVGTRSGEGYFSVDGQKMIFQSEREPTNPFYQIYLMDLITGESERLSPGKGKTTCAWLHPDGKKALFSSTHLDSNLKQKVQQELEQRKNPVKSNYAWSYDENFDLFEVDIATKKLKRLTKQKGYDAEASYSPDGQWIAFASNRNGYTENLSAEEKKLFEQDPSYMMDIFIMKADGSQVKQLTFERGYDGGPFFSPDGSKITWRRFSANGQTAEIYTMSVDGSNQKPVTHLNVMSWAPFFHPSGDYLIFASNLQGYKNFELFIVDSLGEKKPQRVTFQEGFDGLPVFTPDGRHLTWTHRNEQGESQIYWAKWDDEKARALLGLRGKYFHPTLKPIEKQPLAQWFSIPRAREWIEYLSSRSLEGRKSGSAEEKEYAEALAVELKKLGAEPLRPEGYLQPFQFTSGVELGVKNSFKINEHNYELGKQWGPLSFSDLGSTSGDLVFAGFGIKATASNQWTEYDSYRDSSVKGKWVMVLSDIPDNVSAARRMQLFQFSRPHHKALVARQNGAKGLIIVDSEAQNGLAGHLDGGGESAGLPVVRLSFKAAQELMARLGVDLGAIKDKLDREVDVGVLTLKARVEASIDLKFKKAEALNILGQLKVNGAKSVVVIGAHGDHLGRGGFGNSLARANEKNEVHPGADDNASGVAVVLEMARHLADLQQKGELKSQVVFAIWSAEELGNLGSAHFVKTYKGPPIKAYINLDMVGRLRDQLMVQGVGSAKELTGLLEPIVVRTGVPMTLQSDPYLPTDSLSFYLKQIPTVNFFTGAHSEYHTPRDKAETINYEGLQSVAAVVAELARTLVSGSKDLNYVKVKGSKSPMEGRGFRLYLGTIPDYGQRDVKGVRISGTSKDSPAEKAGLKAGDIIVRMGEIDIKNIYDYVYCLQALKANEKTTIKIMRQGQVVELEVTPQLKNM